MAVIRGGLAAVVLHDPGGSARIEQWPERARLFTRLGGVIESVPLVAAADCACRDYGDRSGRLWVAHPNRRATASSSVRATRSGRTGETRSVRDGS